MGCWLAAGQGAGREEPSASAGPVASAASGTRRLLQKVALFVEFSLVNTVSGMKVHYSPN